MDLTGKTVLHRKYGQGTVVAHTESEIKVAFDSGELRFVFDESVFQSFLTLQPAKAQEALIRWFEEERIKKKEKRQAEEKQQVIKHNDLEEPRQKKKRVRKPVLFFQEGGSGTVTVNREKAFLNAETLAYIGALDDFYELYCRIIELYEKLVPDIIAEYEAIGKRPGGPWVVDSRAKKEVLRLCGTVFDQYSCLYLDPPKKLIAQESVFKDFTMYDFSDMLHVKLKSFQRFLESLYYIIVQEVRHRAPKNKQLEYEEVSVRLHEHFCAYVEQQLNEFQAASDKTKITDLPLYVFARLSAVSCYRFNHPVVPSTFTAERVDQSGALNLPTHYCKYCRQHFIGKRTLSLYEKGFGKVLVERRDASADFSSFRMESKLHQLGYAVVDGEMSDSERQNLLQILLERKRITYLEMCSTIEQNIQLFEGSPRHQLAVAKWKKDLKFIGDYVLQNR